MTVPFEHRVRVLRHMVLAARVAPVAPIGSLLKQIRAAQLRPRSSLGRRPRVLEPLHLEAIRQLPCLKCGMEPCGEAAHVRLNCAALGKRTGIGEKPSDMWAVPLCRSCHLTDPDAQHKVGEIAFWHALAINPLRVAVALHRVSPDIVAMRAVVLSFMARNG